MIVLRILTLFTTTIVRLQLSIDNNVNNANESRLYLVIMQDRIKCWYVNNIPAVLAQVLMGQ